MEGLYVARDEDWDYDAEGNLVPVADDEYTGEEDGDWGEGDEGDMLGCWEGAGPSRAKPVTVRKRVDVSDVPDEAYWDDSALVRCWAAALVDFKYHHPGQFAPLVDAPRTPRQKSLAAPLWFGPYDEVKSGKAAAPPPASKATSKKRRKKKDRQPPEPAAKRIKFETPSSPKWCPRSPEYQRAASPPPLALAAAPTPAPAAPLPAPSVTGPQLPTPTAFSPPIPRFPTGTAPRSYPSPPPIVATDAGEPVGTGTPEELLQDALWSWYNAGYQTALYHASLGATGVEKEE